LIAFATNLLEGVTLSPFTFRSTIVEYVSELRNPQEDPYRAASSWLTANVPTNSLVWVTPGEMTYPLMFHAPQLVYGWQLKEPVKPQFAILPAAFTQGKLAPDYVVVFGPRMTNTLETLQQLKPPVSYTNSGSALVFWKDEYRPELFWRRFGEPKKFDRTREAIYFLKRE
jgi:hypothetical protein